VDNGGAGGIFTAINAEKGYFESNGIDEKGRWNISRKAALKERGEA
jgi:hypothetical protein